MRTRVETRIIAQSIVAAMRQHLRGLRMCNLSDDGKSPDDDAVDAMLFDLRQLTIQLAAHYENLDTQDLERYQSYAQQATEGKDGPAI